MPHSPLPAVIPIEPEIPAVVVVLARASAIALFVELKDKPEFKDIFLSLSQALAKPTDIPASA